MRIWTLRMCNFENLKLWETEKLGNVKNMRLGFFVYSKSPLLPQNDPFHSISQSWGFQAISRLILNLEQQSSCCTAVGGGGIPLHRDQWEGGIPLSLNWGGCNIFLILTWDPKPPWQQVKRYIFDIFVVSWIPLHRGPDIFHTLTFTFQNHSLATDNEIYLFLS